MPIRKKGKPPKKPTPKRGSFLDSSWDAIQPDLGLAGRNDPHDAGASGFLYPWSHDLADGDMLKKAMAILKPKVILELGTFEARGTVVLSTAAEYSEEVALYTFDLGHSPVNSLGPTYGVPYEEKYVTWQGRSDDWASWGEVINKRNKRFISIQGKYPNIKLTFIEGLTYDTLPVFLPKIGEWDFCFQDTLHSLSDILPEWELLKPWSKVGSVLVMDDMIRDGAGPEVFHYFVENEKDWAIRHSETGRQQIWIERIK